MFSKKMVAAIVIMIAMFNSIIGNTTSANYFKDKYRAVPAERAAVNSVIAATTSAITSESCAVNNAPDRAEMLSVNLTLENTAGNNTSNLKATLLNTGGVIAAGPTQNYGAINVGSSATRSFTFTVDSGITLGSPVVLTLALADGATDLGTVSFTLAGSLTTQNFDYTTPAAAIPDGDNIGVSTTVAVSGVSGTIQDLDLVITGTASSNTIGSTTVGIDHSWIGDLVVKLISPNNTSVTLIDRINGFGVDGDGLCSSNNIYQTRLDDSATASIDNGCPGSLTSSGPLTGNFKPQNPLSAFNNQSPNGNWTLNVSDLVASDTGSVRSYRLVITSASAACQGKVWNGAASNDWNDAANWSPSGVPAATDSVVIPATGVTNNPTIITPDVTVKNLTLVSPRVLTINTGQTLNVTGTALINGTLTINGAASFASTPGLTGSNVIYNGTAQQTIIDVPYNNLSINNGAGALLAGNITVNGTLALNNGIIDTNGNTLSVSTCTPSAVSGGGNSSYVKGNLTRCVNNTGVFDFPVGTTNGYSPASLSGIAGTGNFNVLAIQGFLPSANQSQSIQRYWRLTPSGITQANLALTYLPADVPSGANPAGFKFVRRSGTTNVTFTPTSVSGNTFTLNGVSSFSDWTLGNVGSPTAASAMVSGRIFSSAGKGLPNALVELQPVNGGEVRYARTNPFGFYRFADVPGGQEYMISVNAKLYSFAPRLISVTEDLTEINFSSK